MQSKLLRVLSLILIISTFKVSALPILTETAGGVTTDIMTLFKDHEDPNLFYFLPNSGVFSKNADGSPVFNLTTWGLQGNLNDGGGLMSFVLRGGLSPEVKYAIEIWLSQNPGKRLAVVPIFDSYITAFGVNGSTQKEVSNLWGTLFKSIDLPPRGGVAETELGVNIMLTGLGAKIISSQLKSSSQSNLNLMLCYTIEGATPLMEAEVTVNYKHVYEKFKKSFSVGNWWWSAEVKSLVEKLYNEGEITIKILGGDATLESYIMRLTDEFIKKYMVEKLGNSAEDIHSGGRFAQLEFNSATKEDRDVVKFKLIKRDFLKNQYCNALPMKDISPYASKLVISMD